MVNREPGARLPSGGPPGAELAVFTTPRLYMAGAARGIPRWSDTAAWTSFFWVAGATSVNVIDWVLPLRVAVTAADGAAARVLSTIVNVAEVAPAATVTEAGAASSLLPLVRPITAPPAGAACESTTLHLLTLPGLRVVGLQVREASVGGTEMV